MEKKYYPEDDGPKDKNPGLGLVHAVFGQGAGKTSRCVGLAVRAAGNGLMVCWAQFMKGPGSGETKIFKQIGKIDYFCPGPHPFIKQDGPQKVHLEHACAALSHALEACQRGAQVIIADEILNTLLFGTLKLEQVLELIQACRGKAELLLSGADAPPEIIEAADYVTELKMIKHPYNQGVMARKGVEY